MPDSSPALNSAATTLNLPHNQIASTKALTGTCPVA